MSSHLPSRLVIQTVFHINHSTTSHECAYAALVACA